MAYGRSAASGLVSADPFVGAQEQFQLRNLEQFGNPQGPGGGGASGASSGGFDIQSLMAKFAGQSNRANKANKKRRNDINKVFGVRMDNAQTGLANLGQSETRRIDESVEQQQATSQQDLTSRGLAGTSLLSSNNNAINRNKNTAISDLNQNVALQRFGTGDNILNQQQQFNERINESGPDLNTLLALLSQLG